MPAPYRRSSQHGLLWVLIVFAGIGCSIAISLMQPKSVHWGLMLAIFMVPIFGSMAIAVALMRAVRGRRVRGIQEMIEREQFIMDPKPPPERKAAVFAPVADLQRRVTLRNGADGITWVALHTKQPSSVCIFEHIHFTGSGKSTQEHRNTIIAWLVPPTGINHLSAYRPHWLTRRVLARGGNVITIGDERFERNWMIFGEEDGARSFFTKSMRLMLEDSPRGESWHVGGDWVACVYDGAFDARNLALFRRRCEEAMERSGAGKPQECR